MMDAIDAWDDEWACQPCALGYEVFVVGEGVVCVCADSRVAERMVAEHNARRRRGEASDAREKAVERLAAILRTDLYPLSNQMLDEQVARLRAKPFRAEMVEKAEEAMRELGLVAIDPALLARVEATNVGRAIDENLLKDGDEADDAKAKYERIVGTNTANINAKLRLAEDCIRQHRGGR